MKNSHQFTVRLPAGLREQIERACEITGLDAATVTRACLQAFCEEVDRTGEIRLPLAVIAKSKRDPVFPGAGSGTRSTPSLSEDPPVVPRKLPQVEKPIPSKK